MLLHQHPALEYIMWQGLVITKQIDTGQTKEDLKTGEQVPVYKTESYIIEDDKTDMKYIYWDIREPYTLQTSNEWVVSNSTTKLIFINDKGEGTEVPQDDIDYYYTDKGSSSGGSSIIGKMLGEFDEISGKYFSVVEDINGIKEVLGVDGEVGEDGSIIDKVNKLEKTVEGNTLTIQQNKIQYDMDKEEQELLDNINKAFLEMITTLAEYESVTTKATDDLQIDDTEKTTINEYKTTISDQLTVINQYHNTIKGLVDNEEFAQEISELNECNTVLNTAINNLNTNVSSIVSKTTVKSSDITTMLNYFAQASLRIKNYSDVLDRIGVLGFGGVLTTNIQKVIETSTSYSRTISELETIINGETGLKETVSKNSTAIEQNTQEISLKCMKYDTVTSEISVSDNLIKLDAGKVLMTGTLTWDSLDDDAKENLKGKDGTNAINEYVTLTGDQIFKYNKEGNPDVTSITLKATVYNVDNPTYTWYYKQQGSTEYNKMSNTSMLYSLTHNNSIWGENNNTITIKVVISGLSSSQTIEDEITVVKLYDGIDGTNGNHAEYVKVTGEQYFKYSSDISQPPTPSSITLTAEQYNFTSTNAHWYYKNSSGTWVELTNYANQNTLLINHTDDIFVGEYATIKYAINTSIYDIFTMAKVINGSDGYAVILSNENHSVPCEADGSYSSDALNDAKTTITIFQGDIQKTSFSVNKTDTGCTSTWSTADKTLSIIKLSANKATVDLKIIVDGKTFNKVMTITKALRGEQGEVGKGIDILGEFDSVDDLPQTANPGDAYVIKGLLYIWSAQKNGWGDGVPIQGEQGLPGKDGEDGQTTYTHIKYSNDGKTFTSNNGEDQGTWIGMYTDFVEKDSSTFSDYKWFKVVGVDGEHGIVANLTNDSHVIPANNDGSTTSASFTGCETTIELTYKGTKLTDGVTYSYTKSSSVSGTWLNGTYKVTGLSADTGYVDLKATYSSVTYTKRFTLSKSVDGQTTYTWIRYADSSSGSGISDSPDGKTYIGFAYNKNTPTESDTASDYTWSLIKGEKGNTGATGPQGNDGQTTYTWIKYSDYSDGNPCYDTPTSTTQYIGIATNKTTETESDDYTKYKWSKFKGDKGVQGDEGDPGYTVNLSNDNHTFIADENGDLIGTTSITTTVTAFKGATSITPTIGTLPTVTGLTLSKSGTTITIKATKSIVTSGTFTIPITIDGKSFDKIFSYSKATDGTSGDDGYTVFLSNESDTFNADSSGNISSVITKTTTVYAYCGATAVTPTINTLPTVTGLTLSKSGSTITIKANTGTSLANSGTINIPITVNGLSFTRVFSWTKVKDGKKGDKGEPGTSPEVPSWITEWENNVTTINGNRVMSPKIFAGSVSSGVPTGVAIGKDVFGTSGSYANATGIVGYKNGKKMYHFKDDGTMEMGSGDNYFKWDGSTMTVKGTITATNGTIGGFTLNKNTLKGTNVGMCSGNNAEWAFWAGASAGVDAPFHVSHNGELYATKANISGNITGETNMNIGQTINHNGVETTTFKLASNGNLKVGGYSAYVHTDGFRKGVAEITSIGTIWSCSTTDPYTYTRMTEGMIEVSNTGYDSEYNGEHGGYVKDSYIRLQNGQIAIYGAKDDKYSSYTRELYIGREGIGSALGHVNFVNRIHVTGNVTTTGQFILENNAYTLRGVDTGGEEVTLVHIGGDNISKFGYGSWASQGNYAYDEGTQFLGGAKAVLKAKGNAFIGCNSSKLIRFSYDSTSNYVFRPDDQKADIHLGTKNYSWHTCYAKNGVNTTSDRTAKENIQYLNYDNINTKSIINNSITTNDCLDFITNDYLLATYNYITDDKKSTKLSAIAQDVISNADGSDNKIGQLIVPVKESVDENALLCISQTQLLNVAIGAIQALNDKVKNLEAQIEELKNK